MNRNTAQRLGSWKITLALLIALTVVSFIDAFGPLYWAVLVLYVAQVLFVAVTRPVPSWRRKDSRTTDGDERG